MASFPVLDNHAHLQPGGRNIAAVRDFERAGGTHLILSHMPYHEIKIVEADDWQREFDITLRQAENVRGQTRTKIWPTLGPYPVRLIRLEEQFGLEKATEIMMSGMELAAEHVAEGKAVGIGEIGRPHFPVSDDIWRASNRIMMHGMKLAKEVSCPVILHTESATGAVWEELALMADKAGLAREMVIKHYSPPLVDEKLNFGLFPSVLASRKSITEALSQGTRFMMETDYLDDLRRPGAVMALTTVPKRTKAFLQSGELDIDKILKIHKDWPERLYGIEIEY